jgi:hypothetical protein
MAQASARAMAEQVMPSAPRLRPGRDRGPPGLLSTCRAARGHGLVPPSTSLRGSLPTPCTVIRRSAGHRGWDPTVPAASPRRASADPGGTVGKAPATGRRTHTSRGHQPPHHQYEDEPGQQRDLLGRSSADALDDVAGAAVTPSDASLTWTGGFSGGPALSAGVFGLALMADSSVAPE